MDIRSALDAIVYLQGQLRITDPDAIDIVRVFKYFPDQNTVLKGQTPAWMNEWTLVSEERHSSMRIQSYQVHMQFLGYDAQSSVAADIATAFMAELVDALDADVALKGEGTAPTVTQSSLRGGQPTLALLNRGRLSYIGLDLFLDLEMKEGKDFS